MPGKLRNCRGVVVAKDGERYMTRWCEDMHIAIRRAQALAVKRKIDVKQIDGIIRHKLKDGTVLKSPPRSRPQ